jgi:hypothetical protein
LENTGLIPFGAIGDDYDSNRPEDLLDDDPADSDKAPQHGTVARALKVGHQMENNIV